MKRTLSTLTHYFFIALLFMSLLVVGHALSASPTAAFADEGTLTAGSIQAADNSIATTEASPSTTASTKVRIANGTYKIRSAAKSLRLNVAKNSWKSGANIAVKSNGNSLSQIFTIKNVGNGYFRIYASASGNVLQAKWNTKEQATKSTSANVVATKLNKKLSSQLWSAYAGKQGTVFINRATGGVLSVSGQNPKSGSNVRTATNKSLTSQEWKLTKTAFKRSELEYTSRMIKEIPKVGNRTIKVQSRTVNFKLSSKNKKRLNSVLRLAWDRGANISFILMDLKTGTTISMGTNRDNYGASAIKAAYVTYVFQELIEKGRVSYDSVAGLINATANWSSNEAYEALRAQCGEGSFGAWMKSSGASSNAWAHWWPRLNARNLACIWAKIYAYEQSGGRYVKEWRRAFTHSNNSFISETLGGKYTVYSKAGWYPPEEDLKSFNDGAIVKSKKGTYLLAVTSNVNCYTDSYIMKNLVKVLNTIQASIPKS